MYKSINPFTEELVGEYVEEGDEAVEKKLQLALKGFDRWKGLSAEKRSEALVQLAQCFEDTEDMLSRTISEEMGKPIVQSVAEVRKSIGCIRFYAEDKKDFPFSYNQEEGISISLEPIGVVLGVMPWNFPLWQVIRFAIPALVAGNVVVIKHAPNVPRVALKIEEVFHSAGLGEGIYTNLFLTEEQTAAVISSRYIAAASVTGSRRAGSAVAATAGKALKPTVLELGGNDPFIVLSDCDISTAANEGVRSRLINSGQTCISAKRFIIEEKVYDEFMDCYLAGLEKQIMGDPQSERTTVGPLARRDLLDNLCFQVQKLVKGGAKEIYKNSAFPDKGYFHPLVVLDGSLAADECGKEELFGPVAVFFKATSEKEAVNLANNTPYGLSASVWSGDISRAKGVASKIEAGSVFINQIPRSDPRVPFGGVKESGYGRELGDAGLKEFVNMKVVWAS